MASRSRFSTGNFFQDVWPQFPKLNFSRGISVDTTKRTRRSHYITLPELASLGFLIPKAYTLIIQGRLTVQEMALYLRETSARKSCLSCRHLAKALNMAGFLVSALVEYSLIAMKIFWWRTDSTTISSCHGLAAKRRRGKIFVFIFENYRFKSILIWGDSDFRSIIAWKVQKSCVDRFYGGTSGDYFAGNEM